MKNLAAVIEQMFMLYVRSEEYVSLNEEGRNEFVDQVKTIKELLSPDKFN